MIEQIKKSMDSFERKGYVPEDMRINCPEWLRYLIGEVERLKKVEEHAIDRIKAETRGNYALSVQVEELQRELAEYREEEDRPRFKMDAQGNLTLVEEE